MKNFDRESLSLFTTKEQTYKRPFASLTQDAESQR